MSRNPLRGSLGRDASRIGSRRTLRYDLARIGVPHVDVFAEGIPRILQRYGRYQMKRPFPFKPSEVLLVVLAIVIATVLTGIAISQPPGTWAQGVDGRP
jgi:hypothetical protein